ncbi:Htur_1727 family rSAM-partnered candidate RiPP [Halomicroarcula sp. GCM10025709]|uniref:Htur_1727 family rSAM-partnered candidate RiPP n=1 Tax=Haloarcula TaxID=2237 RepID=UPI0024C3DC48|nr:Htur_1727 family rSAM-partnered candidate RiPP [Halomicroarcula sp. YJ-61-S]
MGELDHEVDAPRGATSREWEVFVREAAADPLTHAGSVSAPSAEIAREQAEKLFGHAAAALWLCPADETRRFQDEALALDPAADEGDATMDEAEMHAETLRGEDA